MLFMTVFTYTPANRNEVVKRRQEQGAMVPEGIKVLGEWSYTGSGRVFRLIEASDATAAFKGAYSWSDLGTIETYPVMETDAVMTMVAGKQGT
jgi:hypothetical protein